METAQEVLIKNKIFSIDNTLIKAMDQYANQKIDRCIELANDESIDRDCIEFNFNKLKA